MQSKRRQRVIRNLNWLGWLLIFGGLSNIILYVVVVFIWPWFDATLNGIFGVFLYLIGYSLLQEARLLKVIGMTLEFKRETS